MEDVFWLFCAQVVSLSCRNIGMMLLSLQRFRNARLDRFLARKVLSLLKVFTLARILFSKYLEVFNNDCKASTDTYFKNTERFWVVSVSWSIVWRQCFMKWTAMWHCSKLDNVIQYQTDGTILCSLRCHIIFVWIYFWFDAYFKDNSSYNNTLIASLLYTECLILIFASKYLVRYKRYRKMFSIKVLLLWEGHKMVPLVWPWVALLKSEQGHFEFFK